jgi:hypothetical protein
MTAKSYKALTNPKLITVPDPDSIMPSMHTAWKINPDHPMCLIFDAVDPCRKFKRGAVFDESAEEPFADYNPSYDDDLNVTDNDEETDGGTMLMPYLPLDVRYVLVLLKHHTIYLSALDARISSILHSHLNHS